MGNSNQLGRLVARRQKRLIYWQQLFSANGLEPSQKQSIDGHLETYRQLLSKIIKAPNDSERQECEDRIEDLERELSSLEENRRLLTSRIGK